MFPGCLHDFSRMFSGCSDGSCGPGGIWWSFQMKVWTLMIQRNLLIPSYLMIPAIWWFQLFDDPQLFDDQLEVWTLIIQKSAVIPPSTVVLFAFVPEPLDLAFYRTLFFSAFCISFIFCHLHDITDMFGILLNILDLFCSLPEITDLFCILLEIMDLFCILLENVDIFCILPEIMFFCILLDIALHCC